MKKRWNGSQARGEKKATRSGAEVAVYKSAGGERGRQGGGLSFMPLLRSSYTFVAERYLRE
jgi:hypothetical protein